MAASAAEKLVIAKEILIAIFGSDKTNPTPTSIAQFAEAAAKAVNKMEDIISKNEK